MPAWQGTAAENPRRAAQRTTPGTPLRGGCGHQGTAPLAGWPPVSGAGRTVLSGEYRATTCGDTFLWKLGVSGELRTPRLRLSKAAGRGSGAGPPTRVPEHAARPGGRAAPRPARPPAPAHKARRSAATGHDLPGAAVPTRTAVCHGRHLLHVVLCRGAHRGRLAGRGGVLRREGPPSPTAPCERSRAARLAGHPRPARSRKPGPRVARGGPSKL